MKTKTQTSKQILSLVLALVMVLSMLPMTGLTAFAADGDEYATVGDFQVKGDASGYTYESNTLRFIRAGEYTVKNVDPATATADNIEIHAENVVLTMAGVNIKRDLPAMELYAGNHTIILAEDTVNILDSSKGSDYAGLLSKEYSLTIRGEGTLVAKGGSTNGAGIGGGYDRSAIKGHVGNITIEGGVIEAYGGGNGAGIGGSYFGDVFDITISGGTVTAFGGEYGAGIGGSFYGNVSNITISGGTVTATGGTDGAGIGGSYRGSVSNITISGGTVTAIGGEYGAGIGGGDRADSNGTLSSGANGSAIVQASSINADTTGFVDYIEKNGTSYTVHGNVTLSADLTIAEGETLTIPKTAVLTVPEGVTLTNNGTIVNNGTLNCINHNYKNSVCTICGVTCTHSFDTDGKCTSCGIQMAAKVLAGGKTYYFMDLQQAFNSDAVKSGTADAPATVTLLSDASAENGFDIFNAHIILDLNGFEVKRTTAGYAIEVRNGGITVRGEGAITGNTALRSLDSIIKIEGGTLEGTGYGIAADRSGRYARSEIHISGGTIIGAYAAVQYSGLSDITISGGTFRGGFSDNLGGGSDVQPVITGGSFPEGIKLGYYCPALSALLGEGCGYYYADGSKVTLAAGQKEIVGSVTVKKDISGATVTVSDVTYDGTAKEPAVTVKITTADSNSGGSSDSATIILTENVDYTLTYENNTNAGTATVTVTGKGNYGGETIETFTIEKADPEIGTVTAEVVYDTLEASAVVLNRADMTVNGTLTVDAGQELKLGDNEIAYTFTPADTDNYEIVVGTVTVTVKDTIAPTASIKVDTNEWKETLNNVTFGLFFKDTQEVTIAYTDNENGSGIKDMLYYVADRELTDEELAAVEWKAYNGTFSIAPGGKYVIYAKATDNDGNAVVINSDGIVLDKTAAVISGITNGETYYGQVVFGVTDELAGIESVEIDGVDKTHFEGQYVINPDNKEHTVVVTDKAGNMTEYKITVYKNYTVTYKIDGETVSTQTVGHGKDAAAPAIPEKEGYTAVWDKDGKNITADTEINAVYTINEYTVTFMSEDGVYKTVTVKHGEKVTMPEAPKKDGYTVTWEKVLGTVTEDVTVKAVYTEIPATDKPSSAQTGDNSNMALWLTLLLLSGGSIITLTVYDRKRRTVSSK